MNRHLGEDGLAGESITRLQKIRRDFFCGSLRQIKNLLCSGLQGPDLIDLCLSHLCRECFENKLFFDTDAATG